MTEEAQARHTYHCEWEGSEVTHTDTTAVRLLVSKAPAVTWEMALRPDGDIRLFIENQISGFKTDGATGCFADAGAWVPLLALFEKGLVQGDPGLDPDAYEDISDSMYLLRTRDQASGTVGVSSREGDVRHGGSGMTLAKPNFAPEVPCRKAAHLASTFRVRPRRGCRSFWRP
ncbi:DUF4241 domain-containing protein [Streptomyces lavendulae]|uniref:DUF4241 domain-containing protein n=1 Tax=Streptomyces lavendulae TaxID=1914 RepID=UPI00369EBA36